MRPVSQFMRQTMNPSLTLRYQSLGCKKTVAITQALAVRSLKHVSEKKNQKKTKN